MNAHEMKEGMIYNDKNVKVEISYFQLLYNKHSYTNLTRESILDDTTKFIGGYILQTGALWKGTIGHAKIKLTSYGAIEKYLTIKPMYISPDLFHAG